MENLRPGAERQVQAPRVNLLAVELVRTIQVPGDEGRSSCGVVSLVLVVEEGV